MDTFGIGTGSGMSPVVCVDADALGIGTGRGMSAFSCANAEAFGMGTGSGMSVVTSADAAVVNKTPSIHSVEIVFFIVVSPSVVTRLLRARNSKNHGPEFKLNRWFGRAKGEGCESDSESFNQNCTQISGGAIINLGTSSSIETI